MVFTHFIPSLSVALLLTILAVFANPTPAPFSAPFEVASTILERATAPEFDLSQISEQCQDACQDANSKISGCTSDSCFCTDTNLQSFGACLSCVVASPNSATLLDKDTAQSSMNVVTGVCNKEGFKVKDVKIGSSSGASRSAITSFGALAGIMVGAFVIA